MSFSLDVKKWTTNALLDYETFVQKIAIEAFTRVILRSPVKTGRFRGNWQVHIGNEIPDGTLVLDDPSGTASISKATAAAVGFKPAKGKIIYLYNNLPYAWRLETGWSQQAPGGMVDVTVLELQPMVDKVLREIRR